MMMVTSERKDLMISQCRISGRKDEIGRAFALRVLLLQKRQQHEH